MLRAQDADDANIPMINFMYFIGGKSVFERFIQTFTPEYKNMLLYNLVHVSKVKNPKGDFDKQTLKAIKWMLKAGAELWVDGKNCTSKLMLAVL